MSKGSPFNYPASFNGYFPIWCYQDFTDVVGTSLTITQDQNTTGVAVDLTQPDLIIGNSAAVVLSNDENAYPYTSGYNVFGVKLLSKVISAENTQNIITLSGVPASIFKDNIRVWFMRQCLMSNLPVGRQLPKGNALIKIKELDSAGLATDEELLGKVNKAGDTMTGALILPAATPTADNQATHKEYVDDSVFFNVVNSPIFTYNANDNLIGINYSNGASKVMAYSSGILTQQDATFDGITTRKTFNYDSEGFLTSIDEVQL